MNIIIFYKIANEFGLVWKAWCKAKLLSKSKPCPDPGTFCMPLREVIVALGSQRGAIRRPNFSQNR